MNHSCYKWFRIKKGSCCFLRQCFMSFTSHSPIEAALDQGQTFCENSIREGTIFIPRRDLCLLYSIAIDLVLNGGHRLNHMMSIRHIFLRASVQGSWLVAVFNSEGLGWGCRIPMGGRRWLNIEKVPTSLHFLTPTLQHKAEDHRRN